MLLQASGTQRNVGTRYLYIYLYIYVNVKDAPVLG